ncbi:unnamed protein product [Heterobilharzia americana]|nr:unnamed protein product [Heterobilharzia americana]
MNTRSPVHLKYGVIPIVQYPYDSEDEINDGDSDSEENLQTKELLSQSRHIETKPDICMTVNKIISDEDYSAATLPIVNMLNPRSSNISTTKLDYPVQNTVSPSLTRSITSQINNNSINLSVNNSDPVSRNSCVIQQIKVSNDMNNSEIHLRSSINAKNRCFIYDSNKLSAVDDDLSNNMYRSLQP